MPEMARTIREVLETMPSEQRARDEIYRARLRSCLACPELLNGTCRKCGCYVEIRAAKVHGTCPDVPPRW
ncbi:MAG: hypothetical protein IJ083_03500 [Clostridia bacterium]|nr:hypothetical protein [Clostridia bacterium]